MKLVHSKALYGSFLLGKIMNIREKNKHKVIHPVVHHELVSLKKTVSSLQAQLEHLTSLLQRAGVTPLMAKE